MTGYHEGERWQGIMAKIKTVLAIIDKEKQSRVGFVGVNKPDEHLPEVYHTVARSSEAADFTGYGFYVGDTCDKLNKAHSGFDFRAVNVKV